MKPIKPLCLAATFLLTACATHSFPLLDHSRLTTTQLDRLNRAEIDFRRVHAGRQPIYARLQHPLLEDGGTEIYRGDGYYLVARHSIVHSIFREGIIGYTVGPEITIEPSIAGGKPITHKDTHFVPLSK